MTTHTLAELFDKRRELAGQINLLEKQAKQYRADLNAIEGAIRVMRPGIVLPKIIPRRIEFRPRYFKRGELTRLILETLRDHAAAPIGIVDMMPVVIKGRNLNQHEHERLAVSVYQALNKLAKRGVVARSSDGQGVTREGHRHTLWQIARENTND